MIVKIGPRERVRVEEYLNREPEFNLFFLGDLANHGLDNDFLDLWAQFGADGAILAVILRYFGSFLVYAQADFAVAEIAEFLAERAGFMRSLSGKHEVVSKILPYLDCLDSGKIMRFARLRSLKLHLLPAKAAAWQVNVATLADLGRIALLRSQVFSESKTVVRKMLEQGITQGAGRVYFIEVDGQIAATAQTTAEYSAAAMIVGVATAPQYRRRGMATACLYRLCRDLLSEGKSLCLFYENPDAGSLYHRLGFEDIRFWQMATAKKA